MTSQHSRRTSTGASTRYGRLRGHHVTSACDKCKQLKKRCEVSRCIRCTRENRLECRHGPCQLCRERYGGNNCRWTTLDLRNPANRVLTPPDDQRFFPMDSALAVPRSDFPTYPLALPFLSAQTPVITYGPSQIMSTAPSTGSPSMSYSNAMNYEGVNNLTSDILDLRYHRPYAQASNIVGVGAPSSSHPASMPSTVGPFPQIAQYETTTVDERHSTILPEQALDAFALESHTPGSVWPSSGQLGVSMSENAVNLISTPVSGNGIDILNAYQMELYRQSEYTFVYAPSLVSASRSDEGQAAGVASPFSAPDLRSLVLVSTELPSPHLSFQ